MCTVKTSAKAQIHQPLVSSPVLLLLLQERTKTWTEKLMVNFYFPYVNIWKSKRVFTTVLFSSDRSIFARIQIQHHWSSALHTSASCPLGVQQVGRRKWPIVLCSSVLLLSTTVDLFQVYLEWCHRSLQPLHLLWGGELHRYCCFQS